MHGIKRIGSYGVMRIETQASGSRSSVGVSDQRLINAKLIKLQFNVHSGYKCFVFQCTALQTFMQATPRIYLAVVEIKRSLIPTLLP